jgi:alanyl-tRNA synthetase
MKLSQTLNAPLEKLDQTAEKIVKELKEANVERRKLIKELATRESTDADTETTGRNEEVNGIKIIIRDFQDSVDVDRMVQTATEIVKKDEATVTVFYGANEKNARIMVMAGKAAIEKGANAGEAIREASAFIGGGGGGKPNFAQGGGTQVEQLPQAVKKAEEMLKKQLKP